MLYKPVLLKQSITDMTFVLMAVSCSIKEKYQKVHKNQVLKNKWF